VTGPRPIALLSALRPHQWAKNLLVFLPVIAAHKLLRLDAMSACAVAFVAFSLCASAVYVLNDLSDIDTDRQHPWKRHRSIAAGRISRSTGFLTAVILLIGAFLVSFVGVSWRLAAILGIYIAATTAYTVRLKQIPVTDVFTLTAFYILRIVAGGVATETPLSSWFLAFALFLFLSLAFVKRYVALMATEGPLVAREYGPDDAVWMHAIGTSAGYMAVVVLALYLTSPEVTVLYARPEVLWLLCPLLLFWLTRLWFRAGRRLLHDDPVVEVLRDPVGYVTLAVAGTILVVAAGM
jgi:4-hydroxybenzoate polyprenyltransferase